MTPLYISVTPVLNHVNSISYLVVLNNTDEADVTSIALFFPTIYFIDKADNYSVYFELLNRLRSI